MEHEVYAYIETHKQKFIDASDKLWDFAELQFLEHQSAQPLLTCWKRRALRCAGVGRNGNLLCRNLWRRQSCHWHSGEYDALAGLSQKADVAEKPLLAAGHGQGHNGFMLAQYLPPSPSSTLWKKRDQRAQ